MAQPEQPKKPMRMEVPRLGRYRVCYRIAQGGMASVYLARLTGSAGFSKWVALKIIHPNIAADEKFTTMFLDEARLAARLDHPNLCTVFDFGEEDGRHYIAMEYLHGETLGSVARKAWSDEGALAPHIGASIVAQAAMGLHAAHELRSQDGSYANVVHRDVSPENIFVTYAGHTRVVDFGVARSNEQAHERTATGELKGKLAYMSPEQLHERRIDRRTDVWALGAVLWEVTVGRRLFRRQTDAATVFAITRDPITLPSRLRPDYPRDLEAIVMRALERDVQRRYATAQEFYKALEGWLLRSGQHVGVSDVGEFMHGLFAEQIAWRDGFLRQTDGPFRDLIHEWHAPPRRPSAPDNGGLDLGMPIPTSLAQPDRAPEALRPSTEPVAPAPRKVMLPPEEGPAIPLTRKVAHEAAEVSEPTILRPSRDAIGVTNALPLLPRRYAHAAETPARTTPPPVQREVPPRPVPLPPRRRRWSDVATILGLVALGGALAHIWFDRPITSVRRSMVTTTHAARATPPRTTAPPSSPAPAPALPAAHVETPAPVVETTSAPSAADDAGTARARHHHHHHDDTTEDDANVDRSTPGFLRVTSNEPSTVRIGARVLGRTPLDAHSLAPGVYSLHVAPVGRDIERDYIVTIHPGETESLSVSWPDERAMPLAPSPNARPTP